MFVDRLLTAPEPAPAAPGGTYDEVRAVTLFAGEVLVAAGISGTSTETRVGNEPKDIESWASTTTVTKVTSENDDRD